MEEPNLWKLLERDWSVTAAGPEAVAACARWARSTPGLAGLTSPAEVVARCHERGDPGASAALLRAVLGQVDTGPWPARTVLQTVLPGVASVARRARVLLGPGAPWQGAGELDQEAVTIAYDRIAALAGDPPRWPAMAIVDGTWQRLRRAAIAERRSSATCERFAAACAAGPATTAGEELAHLLVDAVEMGILGQVDARLVYANRLEDVSIEELGPRVGHNAWWAYRHRRCAEQLLGSMARAG